MSIGNCPTAHCGGLLTKRCRIGLTPTAPWLPTVDEVREGLAAWTTCVWRTGSDRRLLLAIEAAGNRPQTTAWTLSRRLSSVPGQGTELPLPEQLESDVNSEIARLRTAIGREAVSADRMLNEHPSASEDDYPRWGVAEHRELSRQLAALRERVARAQSRGEDQLLLRAELATLLSFAETLHSDAEAWRSALASGLKEFERQQAIARAERDRLASERVTLVRRRDALQSQIQQTAERIAQDSGGQCRRTMPIFRFGADLNVCSVSVTSPRRGFRPGKSWLVTLNESRQPTIIRRS